MSQSIDLLSLRAVSTGAIARARGVTFGGAQAGANGKILGIANHAATAAGQDVTVTVSGTAVVEAGAAIAIGASLAMDATGRAVTAAALTIAVGGVAVTSAAANGAGTMAGGDPPVWVFGDALQAATAAGQFIEVLLRR